MKKFILSLIALLSIGLAYSYADYTMTQGAGTTFGSKIVSLIHYSQQLICDATAPATQCASVSASGAIKVDNSAVNQPVVGPAASGAALSGNPVRVGMSDGTNAQNWLAALALGDGVNGNNTGAVAPWLWNGTTYDRASGTAALGAYTQAKVSSFADGWDITQGALADAAATAGGTGSVSAKLRLMTSQLGTINTTLGSPFQAGGSIGNTSFGATQSGTWTVQPGNTANTTPWLATINQGGNSAVVKAASTAPAVTDPAMVVALSPNNDPCLGPKSGAPISLTASGQVITGAASKKTYICSIDLISATAQNIALVEGTGTVCATNIYGLAGGTTANTGWNLTANGGLVKGAGIGTVYSPSGDANAAAANVCLLVSSTGQVSGQITYVQQ